jgi:hypothetical protein
MHLDDDFIEEEDEREERPVPEATDKIVRKNGRPRKHPRVELPDVLDIPFDGDPALAILPCGDESQARFLDWYVRDLRSVNLSLGLYKTLPMTCEGQNCFWAKHCPTAPDYIYKGRLCPVEIMEIHRQFVLLCQELEVTPRDTVDLNHIADLVRLDAQIKRIDRRIQADGLMVQLVAGVAQKTGEPVTELGAHPLFALQDKLAARRDRIYKALVISREAKMKKAQAEGKQEDNLLAVLALLKKRSDQMVAEQGRPVPGDEVITIEGTTRALPAGPPVDDNDPDDIF